MKNSKWLIISVIVLLLDQISKTYLSQILMYKSIDLMPGIGLSLAYNQGAAFSILAEFTYRHIFFISFGIIISIYLLIWLLRLPKGTSFYPKLGISLILGGAIGNLVDRITYGHVIDFIDVYYKNWHWPTFNIADTAITIGVGILFYNLLKIKE